ncbi:MAG: flagellin [Pseudomonadota bacterium]
MILTSPDSLQSSTLFRLTQNLRGRLDNATVELATGRAVDSTKAARGDNATLLRAQRTLDSIDPERGRLTVLSGRYLVAASALRSINEVAGQTALTAQAVGDLTNKDADVIAASEAFTAIGSVLATLNTSFGGRSLFAGDAGVGAAVADLSTFYAWAEGVVSSAPAAAADKLAALDTEFAVTGGFDTNAYLAGAQLTDPQLAGGQTIGTLPTADDEAFRDLLKGLVMVATNELVDPAERSQWVLDATVIIQSARDRITTEEASIGLAQNTLDREADRLSRELFDAESTIERILGRDPFEVATETQSLEVRLQALYTVTARTSSLRLTNFLR